MPQPTRPEAPTWGEGVRILRGVAGLSQVDLASRAGTSQAHISRIENGSREVSDAIRVRIAKVLGVKPHELFPYLEDEDGAA